MRAIARTLVDAAIGDDTWPRALARLARSFRGFESNFLVWDRKSSRVTFSAWADFPHQECLGYARCEALVRSRAGQVILTQNLPDRLFLHDEIYNEFLRPLGTRYLMGLKLADSDSKVAMLRVHRGATNGPYGSEDARKFRLLLPDFSRAARIHLNQYELTQQHTVAAAVLDQLQIGIVVIDRERHVLHANALARDLFVSGGVAVAYNGRIRLRCADSDAQLRHVLEEATNACSGSLSDAALGLRTFFADDWQLSISPFVADGSLNLRYSSSEAFLVTLKRVEQRRDDLAATLASQFRLTPAETGILEQIIQGGSLEQIAARRSVSINTVKTHLKSVFFKMDVCSQADLIRVVLARGNVGSR